MIITDTAEDETLKPPILEVPISRSTSPIPPPIHPTMHYGHTSPVTPPGYAITTRPTDSVTYIFEPQEGQNLMRLSAPNHPDGRSYLIAVNLNCFTPSSHITTIRKYDLHGELALIGDFEIGASGSKNPSTVFVRGNEYPLEEVLTNFSRFFRNQWMWKPLDRLDNQLTLYWDESSGGNTMTCFTSKDRTNANLLAKFIPKSHRRKPGREIEFPKLEVTPLGHEVFEDILMSSLIIERLRTNP